MNQLWVGNINSPSSHYSVLEYFPIPAWHWVFWGFLVVDVVFNFLPPHDYGIVIGSVCNRIVNYCGGGLHSFKKNWGISTFGFHCYFLTGTWNMKHDMQMWGDFLVVWKTGEFLKDKISFKLQSWVDITLLHCVSFYTLAMKSSLFTRACPLPPASAECRKIPLLNTTVQISLSFPHKKRVFVLIY